MNILQVLPELNSGGVETGTIDLARQLIKHGNRAVVVSNGGRLLESLLAAGGVHYQLPVHEKSPFAILGAISKIKDIIKKEHIDIVHARSRVPAISAFFAARSLGVPFITTCHGYYSKHIFSRVMGWGKIIIVPSNAVARHMISAFKVPVQRIRLIPRGVDLEKFRFVLPEDRKDKQGFTIAVIGRITPIKGHIYLIRAMSKVARVMPNIKLKIIGSAPASKPKYRQELEMLVKRLSISGHVDFSGDCDNVPECLKSIDLLVVPSVGQEAFGRVIIEAQASGVPVIASRIGGMVDIIKDNYSGILVNPRDHSGLADAILRVIKDKALTKKISENARLCVERKFTLEAMYDHTMNAYKDAKDCFKLLVIKSSALGDIMLSLQALKAIRKRFPSADIALLTSRQGVEITGRFSYVDDFFMFRDFRGVKGFFDFLKIASELWRFSPDLVCDLQNNKKSHIMSFLSFAEKRIGYKTGKFDFMLTEAVSGARDIMPPIQHQFILLKKLGISRIPSPDQFPVTEKEDEYADGLIIESWAGKKQKIIGINLGASDRWHTKRWPLENIAKLSDMLASWNARVFITGTKSDTAQAKKIMLISKSKPFDITGRTTIMQLAAFIKKCDVFISGDSAPMHIAHLCNTPFIALFGPTDPARHFQGEFLKSPVNSKIIYKKIKCSPCYRTRCRHMKCMQSIAPEEVSSAVREMFKD